MLQRGHIDEMWPHAVETEDGESVVAVVFQMVTVVAHAAVAVAFAAVKEDAAVGHMPNC